jgi:hypothetical protein
VAGVGRASVSNTAQERLDTARRLQHSLAFAWLFLALLLSLRSRAITSTSRLRMLPSHLGTMRNRLGLARPLSHLMGPVSGASSPGSFAGVYFGLVSPGGSNIALISGLELVPVCSGLITCAYTLAIMFGCVPDFVFTFACARSRCTAFALARIFVE